MTEVAVEATTRASTLSATRPPGGVATSMVALRAWLGSSLPNEVAAAENPFGMVMTAA